MWTPIAEIESDPDVYYRFERDDGSRVITPGKCSLFDVCWARHRYIGCSKDEEAAREWLANEPEAFAV